MPTPEQMIAAVHAYVAAFDAVMPRPLVALFAEDATVEDPVGTPARHGHDAIRAFYTASMQTGAKLHAGKARCASRRLCRLCLQVRLNWEWQGAPIDVIDTFRFNDAMAKVTEMRGLFRPHQHAQVNSRRDFHARSSHRFHRPHRGRQSLSRRFQRYRSAGSAPMS
jgi:steroid delta-isomerase